MTTSLVGCADDPGDEPGPSARCTPSSSEVSVIVPVLSSSSSSSPAVWKPLVAISPTSVLASAPTSEGDVRLAFIDENGVHDVTLLEDADRYALSATRVGGCAVVASRHGLGYACPGQPYEVATLDDDVSGGAAMHAVEANGEVVVFTQTFSSFTQIVRRAPNQWMEVEQYESSISTPTDALLVEGTPLACFIDSGRRVTLSYLGEKVRSTNTTPAAWCKVALEGDTLHVLTDIGRTTAPLASLVRGATLALDESPTMERSPARLVMIDGTPTAVFANSGDIVDSVLLAPLDGSAPRLLPMKGDYDAAMSVDDATGALTYVGTHLVPTTGSAVTERELLVQFETHCL